MIRAAAKNFNHVAVISSKLQYGLVEQWLIDQRGELSLEQRRTLAAQAFTVVRRYDIAIDDYFNAETSILRYGENPHQQARFIGKPNDIFHQLHGKELSYNNLVDVDAALQLISEFDAKQQTVFAIIKHTNVCGIATRHSVLEAWQSALAGDPESAFGGVLVCNAPIDEATALAINDIFFEVLLAPQFSEAALAILQQKKNRILLQWHGQYSVQQQSKSLLNGNIIQDIDLGNTTEWNDAGGRTVTEQEKADLLFANLVCKHLKSNAIALVKEGRLLGKGCGQTSRIDALKQAIEKAEQFGASLDGAVLASDAFFPFDDCVKMAHAKGITAFIQPGGSIRDKDSITYCVENKLAMIITGMRHFKH
jgi:phosphoribosylaminoimidazolecarboxamide formyltransferase/IMP cyclohydrolase